MGERGPISAKRESMKINRRSLRVNDPWGIKHRRRCDGVVGTQYMVGQYEDMVDCQRSMVDRMFYHEQDRPKFVKAKRNPEGMRR